MPLSSVPNKSPSLRGSGLKLEQNAVKMKRHLSPSLRGSGLKSFDIDRKLTESGLPLYEGVD